MCLVKSSGLIDILPNEAKFLSQSYQDFCFYAPEKKTGRIIDLIHGHIVSNLSCIFFTSGNCGAIRVTDYSSEGKLYVLSNARASASLNRPVWKNFDGTGFIFNNGSTEGWRIGDLESLTDSGYFCKSKQILMSFTIANICSEYLCT